MSFDALSRFREIVAGRLGLAFDEGRAAFVEEVVGRHLAAAGQPLDAWLVTLEGARAGSAPLRELARDLTVTETSFFRHMDQLRAFAETAAPRLLRARPGPLRVLSAGCASGEEPSSLVILLRDRPEHAGREIAVRAIDINASALERARRGRYSEWALRETPADVRTRWFRREGAEFLLDEEVRRAIVYEERNLVDEDPLVWAPGAWDVVFCRNVLMYFSPALQKALVARFARSLAPGGVLFLGHAETLRGVSDAFHLRQAHGAFYYERRDRAEGAGPSADLPAPRAPALNADGSWVGTISRASDRIASLAAGAAIPPEAARRPEPTDLRLVIDLISQERHAEARAVLRALPTDRAGDADALLLRAVLLTHGGDLRDAEGVCAALLAVDGQSAGARYLMALCREDAGDPGGAEEQDQLAVHLDPGFAMPRLHLGLLARRAGDLHAARRELSRALSLLELEDASRILLFGGGFGREALVALCRAELVACGGTP